MTLEDCLKRHFIMFHRKVLVLYIRMVLQVITPSTIRVYLQNSIVSMRDKSLFVPWERCKLIFSCIAVSIYTIFKQKSNL